MSKIECVGLSAGDVQEDASGHAADRARTEEDRREAERRRELVPALLRDAKIDRRAAERLALLAGQTLRNCLDEDGSQVRLPLSSFASLGYRRAILATDCLRSAAGSDAYTHSLVETRPEQGPALRLAGLALAALLFSARDERHRAPEGGIEELRAELDSLAREATPEGSMARMLATTPVGGLDSDAWAERLGALSLRPPDVTRQSISPANDPRAEVASSGTMVYHNDADRAARIFRRLNLSAEGHSPRRGFEPRLVMQAFRDAWPETPDEESDAYLRLLEDERVSPDPVSLVRAGARWAQDQAIPWSKREAARVGCALVALSLKLELTARNREPEWDTIAALLETLEVAAGRGRDLCKTVRLVVSANAWTDKDRLAIVRMADEALTAAKDPQGRAKALAQGLVRALQDDLGAETTSLAASEAEAGARSDGTASPRFTCKAGTVALALGVDPRTVSRYQKNDGGFPKPRLEGKSRVFDVLGVERWARSNGRSFRRDRLPPDLVKRLKDAEADLELADRDRRRHEDPGNQNARQARRDPDNA